MLIQSSLVSAECLCSSVNDMTKHIITEKLNFEIKRGKVLTWEMEEVRKIHPYGDAIVEPMFTFLVIALSRATCRFALISFKLLC